MTQRILDTNSWWEIKRNPISKVGVFPYSGRQIGAPDPDRIYMVLRPPEELGSAETLDSFRLMPITDDHTMLGDGRGLTPAERKGAHGTIGDRVEFDGDTLYGNIKIWSSAMHDKIAGGKRELSCGYRCTYDFTGGTWRGQNYDVVQRQMRGNHLALVKQGRMGPDVCVQDHVTMDAQEFVRMDPEVKAALDAIKAGMDSALAAVAAIPALVSQVTALDAKVTALDSAEPAEMSEDDMAALKAANETKAKEAEDATAALITKAVDSAMKAHNITPPAAMDAKQIVASIGKGLVLAKRLEPHIGTFDHSAMDLNDVDNYGYAKLVEMKKIPDAGDIGTATLPVLDTWLTVTAAHRPVATVDSRDQHAVTGASLFAKPE